MATGSERVRRLNWLCRRGMKELDILLEHFIRAEFEPLTEGSWPEFETLLQTEDDILWDWIQEPGHAGAAPYRSLLEQIRRGAI